MLLLLLLKRIVRLGEELSVDLTPPPLEYAEEDEDYRRTAYTGR
jgi:hypothetical protein